MSSKPWLTRSDEHSFWKSVSAGDQTAEAARRVGLSTFSGKKLFREAGGVKPRICPPGSGGRLSLTERERIEELHAQRIGVRAIAAELGRDPSTISRELRRHRRPNDKPGYRARTAQRRADAGARRPKPRRLAERPQLAAEVQARLDLRHSPEQIAARLAADFPADPEMRVSHETIYKEIYLQGRGALRRDLAARLRTGRAMRRPRGRSAPPAGGRFPGMVMISERPAEADDRAVPGHWEGDLILGAGNRSAIGTLVERTTGYVLLLHLPGGHGAGAVEAAVVAEMAGLPDQLRRTLAWDQGSEMANHIRIAQAADIDIYFCDPHSPWQRGSNENTNGLLRQYFPKSTDLSVYDAGYLDYVAMQLNTRPRKRHAWKTPAEVLDQLFSQPDPRVAFTA